MKKITILLIGILLFPLQVFAYSNYVILGGESIGIHIDTPGVMIISFYQVNGEYLKGNPELVSGDLITHVNGTQVTTIEELTSTIEKEITNNQVILTINRDGNELRVSMPLEKVDGVYKTGLYVKDSITGIGTLTYIDPESKIYGALGHEILESTTSELVEVKTGMIFETAITSINKSSTGVAGSKNATFNTQNIFGDIQINGNHGIFGVYDKPAATKTIEVAKPEEVRVGKATIYTVLDGVEKEKFTIEITKINEYNQTKNITFEITDEKLINKTGGVVQGMSGSPIVQNGKIIGAVTHVIVDNPLTGYGIFITTMLETGDGLSS